MHSEGFDLDCSFICICHVHHYDSNSSATLFQERSGSEQHNPCTTLIVSLKFLKHLARRWIRRPRSLSRLQLSSEHTASNPNQKLQPNEDEWHSEIPVHSKRPTKNLAKLWSTHRPGPVTYIRSLYADNIYPLGSKQAI